MTSVGNHPNTEERRLFSYEDHVSYGNDALSHPTLIPFFYFYFSHDNQVTVNGHADDACDVGGKKVIAEVREENCVALTSHALDKDFAPKKDKKIEGDPEAYDRPLETYTTFVEEDAEAVDVPLEEDTEHVEEVDCIEEVEENGMSNGQDPEDAHKLEDGQEETGCAENEVVELNVTSHEESNELVVNSEPLSNAIEEAIEEVENDVHCAETLCSGESISHIR
ncbi:unnamed protein product [Rodentolepis nana]|uniref:Midasin n=1 Tax=Rodentolepis nana TaxID=102285 RepID=A0A0R3TFN2_RODNA|nr:unnamed protein product [Rodentolepis nana]